MIPFAELRNESNSKFIDISSEEWREYHSDGRTGTYITRIENPIALNVSRSGGHRICDAHGICHYVAPGWKEIKWKPREGQPHFVA